MICCNRLIIYILHIIEYGVLRQVRLFCFTRSAYPSQKAFKQGLVLQVIVGKQNLSGSRICREAELGGCAANQGVQQTKVCSKSGASE